MLACFQALPTRSIVVMHACCHNPTGVDLTPDQWRALVPVIRERGLMPVPGPGLPGLWGWPARKTRSRRACWPTKACRFLIANSFSKSMSLYGERCGAL